jgi:hypothetical protein
VQVEGEGAAALLHLLDHVLADPGEAEECRAVAVEAVAWQDEVHHVQEELGEGGEGVLAVHVGVGWGQTNENSTCTLKKKKYTWCQIQTELIAQDMLTNLPAYAVYI